MGRGSGRETGEDTLGDEWSDAAAFQACVDEYILQRCRPDMVVAEAGLGASRAPGFVHRILGPVRLSKRKAESSALLGGFVFDSFVPKGYFAALFFNLYHVKTIR